MSFRRPAEERNRRRRLWRATLAKNARRLRRFPFVYLRAFPPGFHVTEELLLSWRPTRRMPLGLP